MSSVSFGESASSYVNGLAYNDRSVRSSGAGKASSAEETTSTAKKNKVSGRTIGEPQLSDEAMEYYEQLKKKYSNMDFILVSKDQKETAKAQAASYANANKMVVLIDEEKIERMATDENYRKQYESIISNAASGLSSLGSQLSSTGAKIKGYGMQVNDGGTASFFAVLEKSSAAQRERIEKKAEEKKEAKKSEAKKTAKEEREERLKKADKDASKVYEDDDTVTITASSVEELMQKVSDYTQMYLSDTTQTDAEKLVGQSVDYSV